jgi:protein gp37
MSKIEWTDETWNPIIGCSKASAGCKNCYAERMARRQSYMRFGCEYTDVVDGNGWNDKTAFVESAILKPLRWRKPRKVFVVSMGDLFHETVHFEWIDKVFAVMALCPQHTFQVLTKRPDRMLEYLTEHFPQWDDALRGTLENYLDSNHFDFEAFSNLHVVRDCCDEWHTTAKQWPLPNVWLGTSVEDQAWANKRIPYLVECPAAVRFVSIEPMLGHVDIEPFIPQYDFRQSHAYYRKVYGGDDSPILIKPGIDWVICGGESGPGARPMHPDWVRSLRDQCKENDVPFLFKQWGEWAPDGINRNEHSYGVSRVGKKAAGRKLDGVEHNEYPKEGN